MKKINVLILVCLFWAMLQNAHSQNAKIEFVSIENCDHNSNVYFEITKPIEDPEKEILISKLIHASNSNIQHVKITGTKVAIRATASISAEYVRNFLLQTNLDFAVNSVVVRDEELLKEIKNNNK